ncbi:hypothetical protein BCV70DRAFT_159928 [Testicularia cyperi]|uniref:DNA mismatch repair proteins mutS family domain-containing protein n=1 Tax=Testicularia cyperi TaxID=1882483 RepID=A0A317XSR7_9BASI|nr:hypothetical protein BCV70DRAFT_159928 [Testicularia cyperi]
MNDRADDSRGNVVERPSSALSISSSSASFKIPGVDSRRLRSLASPQASLVADNLQASGRLHRSGRFEQTSAGARRPTSTADPFSGLLSASFGSQSEVSSRSVRLEDDDSHLPAFRAQRSDIDAFRPASASFSDIATQEWPGFDARESKQALEKPPFTPSRPFTASSYHRSRLMTADGSIGNYVCALLENRGVGHEVGIASIDRDTGLCVVTQIADSSTYVHTIHHLSMHPPRILLVPASAFSVSHGDSSASASRVNKRVKRMQTQDLSTETEMDRGKEAGGSMLIRCLEELFDIQATPYHRKHWNHVEGARYLDKLLVDDISVHVKGETETASHSDLPRRSRAYSAIRTAGSSVDLDPETSTRAGILVAVAQKYYLLSAVSALFDFFTETFNRLFTPKSLRIRFVVPRESAVLTLRWSDFRCCATPMGRRLLKTNILQPLANTGTICIRQDAVAEFIRGEERFYAVREALKPLRIGSIDLDKLIHSLSAKEKRILSERIQTERKIEHILSLRTLLRSIGPLQAALQGCSSQLLLSIEQFLESEELTLIREAIDTTIDEDIIHARGGLGSRNAKMYAIKAERSPLLDVARETYRENINDILELCDRETRDHGLALKPKMIANGFLFQTQFDSGRTQRLADHFTNITYARNGRNVTMMTLELKKLNARLLDSMNEVCTMSDIIIEELREEIVDKVAALYKVSEAISILDMIVSFAQVSIANGYVRPDFGDTFDIRDARHPILDRCDTSVGRSTNVAVRRPEFVANDIIFAPQDHFCLVTGPNLSGKSTLLRQIALITVMAGVGCFVPAARASLSMPDALLSLLTHEEDPAQNLSTFAAEMRTSAFILSIASPKSLVLLDELGRGTSPEEGCAIAAALSEELIVKCKSTVFFATHFGELIDGLAGQDGVTFRHLEVGRLQRAGDALVFHHKLHEGPGRDTHYSLQVARMMHCFGDAFMERAERIAANEKGRSDTATETSDAVRRRRNILRGVAGALERGFSVQNTEHSAHEHDRRAQKNKADHSESSLLDELRRLQISTVTLLANSF